MLSNHHERLPVVMVGLGKQAKKCHLPAIIRSSQFKLVAVCDTNDKEMEYIGRKYNVPGYTSLNALIDSENFQVAIVSIPHGAYLKVIHTLATAGKHIIKDKPFATNLAEAQRIVQMVSGSVYLGVTLPRRFEPTYRRFHELQNANAIGRIYSAEGVYTMNIAALDEGWRASAKLAGGGALVDMGYHSIDLLLWYFGLPTSITARTTRTRVNQLYDVEDTAYLLFDYELGPPHHKLLGNFVISRVRTEKQEYLRVFGTKGSIKVSRNEIRLMDTNGNEIERLASENNSLSTAVEQLEFFADKIHRFPQISANNYTEHLERVAFIEAAYASNHFGTSCSPSEYLETIRETNGEE